MQFYKKRSFGELVSDSFLFFKENGKNYFKNYILINGLLLILLVVTFIFGYKELFSQLFGSNIGGEAYHLENYFLENQTMLILVSILVFILFIALLMVSLSYPVLYMKRWSETRNKNIKADDILNDIKSNLGRYLKLLLGLIFIVFPALTIIWSISYVLIFIVIGFFLLLLVMPASSNIINFLVFDYFHTDKGFFASLGYAIKAQFAYPQGNGKTPFWKYWGATAIIYMIIQTITSIVTIIPMFLFIMSSFIIPESNGTLQQNPLDDNFGVLFFVFYALSIIFSFIVMNVLYVNAGLQYYDSRTDLHREENLSEIDMIGEYEV